MKTFNDYFPNVFVVSPLAHRFKRRLDCFDFQMKYLGIDYKVHTGGLYSTLKEVFTLKNPNIIMADVYNRTPTTWLPAISGAFVTFSHIEIIQYAYDCGFENICVFEDDVLLHKDFLEIFNKGMSKLPKDWELLYFGALYEYDGSKWLDNDSVIFNTIGRTVCSHSYCLSRSAMKRVLDDFHSLIADDRFLIIDLLLGYETKIQGMKTFGFLPKLTEQGYFGGYFLSDPTINQDSREYKDVFTINDVCVREDNFEENKSITTVTKDDYVQIVRQFKGLV